MSDDRQTETPRDDGLEAFFAAARADAPTPSDDLVARILADADAVHPAPVALAPRRSASPAWRDVLRGIGGWPALAGLATATVAGLWIGVQPPSGLDFLGSETYDMQAAAFLDPASDFGLLELEEG